MSHARIYLRAIIALLSISLSLTFISCEGGEETDVSTSGESARRVSQ